MRIDITKKATGKAAFTYLCKRVITYSSMVIGFSRYFLNV